MQHGTALKLGVVLLAPALVLPGCKKNEAPKGPAATETVTAVEMADGAAVVDTVKMTATVSAIDSSTRKVTLKLADGTSKVVKCGPAVVNFNQIQLKDKVSLTVTEELAVYLGAGAPPSAGAATAVALAPVGAKPGGVIADTAQVTAKVTAVDPAKRLVTLALPDGTSRTFKAGKRVEMGMVKVGDDVTVQYTEAIAISVEKA